MTTFRSSKPKFETGEKVLCYEPDPKKIKMLYDARVDRIRPSDEVLAPEERNRRGFAYFVHFLGWNSHWDRYVADDMLMKDNPANRAFQRNLYEQTEDFKSKMERKKKNRKSMDKARLSFDSNPSPVPSENTSEFCYQLKRGLEERLSVQEDDDVQFTRFTRGGSRAGSERGGVDEELGDTDTENELPESPSSSRVGDEGDKDNPDNEKDDKEDACTELIPLILPASLKEGLETDYYAISAGKLVKLPAQPNIITLLEGYVRNYAISKLANLEKQIQKHNQYRQPDKDETELYEEVAISLNVAKEVAEGVRVILDFHIGNILLYPEEADQFESSRKIRPHMESMERLVAEPSPIPNKNNHKKQKNCNEAEDPIAKRRSLRKKESESEGVVAGSVGSAASSGTDTPTHNAGAQAAYPQTKQSLQILQDLYSWKLVPESVYFEEPVPASLVYGGVHLTRLLVKLPDLFLRMKFPEEKLKHLMKFLEFMVDYINSQDEVFSDSVYS